MIHSRNKRTNQEVNQNIDVSIVNVIEKRIKTKLEDRNFIHKPLFVQNHIQKYKG